MLQAAESHEFPRPVRIEIHTGAQDTGCDPQLAIRFAAAIENAHVHVVQGAGHDLPEEYLRAAISKFIDFRS